MTSQHPQDNNTIGLLLTNLGTPTAPRPKAVRKFLAELLADPRVVELPKPLWYPILHSIILPLRSRRSAKLYQKIWSEEGSPLLVTARKQAHALQQKLSDRNITIALGMRYGTPSIAEALDELKQAGARRLLVFPLYPQYSAATSGSTFDAVAAQLKKWRWVPALQMINHYADHPDYINAVASSIEDYWRAHQPAEKLLFSFHGMRQKTLAAGDPYYCFCMKSARLIAERLQLPASRWQVVFQSRFGKAKWFQPYCVDTLVELAQHKVTQVDIVCPGFSADCLETLEEISQRNRDLFIKAGGQQLNYIPALNASAAHIDMLANITLQTLQQGLQHS